MLNQKQKKVALESPATTLVSASPGTGKTKTLVARAQHKLETMPRNKSLALITYTNAAADEIASRLIWSDAGVFIGTIHRFCLEYILRPFGWLYGWKKPRIVTFSEIQEFLELNQDLNLGDSPIDELNKIKKTLAGTLDDSVDWNHGSPLEYVSDLYLLFLRTKGVIDFNEILYRSFKILVENDFVASSLASKFFEISVDEFQDTNIFQYEILKAINRQATCTFFLVGDEKQKIYRFAGAIDNAFETASADFAVEIDRLDVTYRSTSNIIKCYSCLYNGHPELKNESAYKSSDIPIVFNEADNDHSNRYIEDQVNTLVSKNKIDISNIAILTNSWREAFFISRHIRQKFPIVGLGALPHRSVNSSAFSLMRCLARFYFMPSMRNLKVLRRNVEFHCLESNIVATERELTYFVNALVTETHDLDPGLPLLEGLVLHRERFDFVFKIDHSSFDEIVAFISDEEAANWTIGKYMRTLAGIEGLTINTIHQSKGLEYDVVFLVGVNEGQIPYQTWDRVRRIRGPLTPESLIDGRAKLYVGISRAKLLLFITHGWRPSLFIQQLKASAVT